MAFNPYFFCDSPLPMELIQKALMELGEMKPTVDELKAKVDKLIADLDGAIQDEVQRVIDEMYENGEFQNIIENLFNDYFNNVTAPKEFKVDTRREFRVALYSMPYDAKDYNNLNYSYCQGGNYFVKNGVKYYIGCYRISLSKNLHYKNDNADIRLYAYIDGKWNFIRNNIYSVGHANDIRYIPALDKFFVVKSSEYNGGTSETPSFDVCVIDWLMPAQLDATFTIPSAAIYPRRDRITCIDYYDGKYWILIGSGGANPVQIYTCDIAPDTYEITNFTEYAVFYIPYNAGTGSYVMQGAGFCQNEDYIFLGNTAPAGIYRFNKRTKSLDCFYNIGPYSNNHLFPTGEVENLSIVDNIIYIGTSIHGNQRLSYFDYNQVFSFDFVNGLTCPNKVITTYGSYNRTITVGMEGYPNNADYYTREICNPNGLKGDNGMPFPTWEEVALFINAQDLWTTLTITPITKNTPGYLALDLGKCNIYIDGSYYYNNLATESDEIEKYPRIAGISVEGGSLDLTHILIMNRAPEAAGPYAKFQITTRFNMFNANYVALVRYLRPEGNELLQINRGFANLGVIYTNNGANVSWNNNNLEYYNCSINTHGQWGGSANSNIIA